MKIGKMVVPYEMANVRFHDGCHVTYPRCEGLRRTLGGESVAGFDEDFAYDPIGNRVSATDYDETARAGYDFVYGVWQRGLTLVPPMSESDTELPECKAEDFVE